VSDALHEPHPPTDCLHAAHPNPYERHLVSADDAHEILVMTWRAGGLCAPHDHGEAGGRVHLVSGTLIERRYRFDGVALVVESEAQVEAPALLEIGPGVIHDMRASPGTVTVHVYRPRVLGMRIYDVGARETLIVGDDCGAWIPSDPGDIQARIGWAQGAESAAEAGAS